MFSINLKNAGLTVGTALLTGTLTKYGLEKAHDWCYGETKRTARAQHIINATAGAFTLIAGISTAAWTGLISFKEMQTKMQAWTSGFTSNEEMSAVSSQSPTSLPSTPSELRDVSPSISSQENKDSYTKAINKMNEFLSGISSDSTDE